MEYANDAEHFQLLQRVASQESAFISRIQPSDIDKLAVETALALERCSVPESSVSIEEREINELMCGCIGSVDFQLSQRTDSHSGAMLLLYRRAILTPANLEALCKMCDPSIRMGRVFCHAIWHLDQLCTVRSVWSIQLKDGILFPLHLIQSLAKVLDPAVKITHGHTTCSCSKAWSLLGTALGVCKDPPEMVVPVLLDIDWPAILQRADALRTDYSKARSWWDLLLFVGLHRWAVSAVHETDNDVVASGTALLKKLGSCETLCKRVLRRIISGEIWSPTGREKQRRFQELAPVANFLVGFLYCLVPLPQDRDFYALVRRARMVLMESFMSSLFEEVAVIAEDAETSRYAINEMNFFLNLIDEVQLERLKSETEQERWERFRAKFLSPGADPMKSQRDLSKRLKKVKKKNLKFGTNLSEGEMCANCFALEKSIGYKLLKCSRCEQIRYCSRECQKEHWKKAHKKQCKKMPKEESGKHSKDGADDSGRPQTDESNDREEPADDRSRPERNENSFRIPLVLLFPCVGMSVYAAHRLKLLNVTGMGLIGATSLYFFFFAPSPGKRKRGTGV